MDFLEELVMWNLGARYPGELVFCPQFDINDGWGCPDFLVLYPRESQVLGRGSKRRSLSPRILLSKSKIRKSSGSNHYASDSLSNFQW